MIPAIGARRVLAAFRTLCAVQAVVGIVILGLGLLHFVDRDRPPQAIRASYFLTPRSPATRGALALGELVVGAVALLTS